MILTKEQQEILNGSRGQEMAKVMETVIRYGELFGAERLVPVTSKYININGDAYEIIGVLGHNGAGKSTTIKCVTGMHPYVSTRALTQWEIWTIQRRTTTR